MDLLEVTDDPSRLDDDGFWAVAITFEGKATFARFGQVSRDENFPVVEPWGVLDGTWSSSLNEIQFKEYVEKIREEIANGVVYQTNACRVLSIEAPNQSLASLFTLLLKENPAPHSMFMRLPDLEIASASPELFLERSGHRIKTSPIKGTQSLNVEPSFGDKDQGENVMIVDLMRNDLGRICKTGTVAVADLLRSEDHPGIRHLVSDVVGELRDQVTWGEIFKALMPPGSVSGTPKSSAMTLIESMEPVPREIYCGTLGWIEGAFASLNVAIRTFWSDGETLKFGTGGGITWPSDATKEWRETQLKANRLTGIAGGVDEDGWQYGSGIFETIRVEDGIPQLLGLHIERATKSARELGITIPTESEIREQVRQFLGDHGADYSVGRMRLSFGKSVTMHLAEYVPGPESLRIQTQTVEGRPGVGGHKEFPYWNNLDLLASARSAGCDEVLLLDSDGFYGEGATCSYLFLVGDRWVTPPLERGVLPGVIRGVVLENGLASEGEISEKELSQVKAIVTLSSLRIATPVSHIDDRVMEVGAETQSLFARLTACLRSSRYR